MGESWRWQLRDADGLWVKMGSKVKWLSRGKWMHGEVVGSPRQNYATVKPAGGGPTRNIDVRRMSVEVPSSHAARNPTVTVPPEVHAGERSIVRASDLKVGDWVDLPAQDVVKPLDPNWSTIKYPAFVGQVTEIEPRGKGWVITITGEGTNRRKIPVTKTFPPLVRITPPQPKPDAGVGRPTRVPKAKVEAPAAVKTPSKPHGTIGVKEVGRVTKTSRKPIGVFRYGEKRTIPTSIRINPTRTAAAKVARPGTLYKQGNGTTYIGRLSDGSTYVVKIDSLGRADMYDLDTGKKIYVLPNSLGGYRSKMREAEEWLKNPTTLMEELRKIGLMQPDGSIDEPVEVKDAQPEVKSPEVQAVEKKALAVKTDTRLAEIYEARLDLNIQQGRLAHDIQRSSGSVNSKPRYSTGPARWDRSLDEAMTDFQGKSYDRAAWERGVAKYQANQQKLDVLETEAGELNAIYTENGGWTRAFLVTNQGGHVHRSMSCSTCYPTTRFHWLPEYSGSDESQIVDDAGERACTVCYPTAPVSTLQRATKIFSEDEKAQAIARQERAAAKATREAAQNAKAISNPDGTDLWVMDAHDVDRSKQPATRYSPRRYGEHLRTETAARQWYVRHEADYLATQAYPAQYRYGSAYNPEAQEQILLALAAKHSKTVEEIRAELAIKAKAKANQQLREAGLPKIA